MGRRAWSSIREKAQVTAMLAAARMLLWISMGLLDGATGLQRAACQRLARPWGAR